jgi:hypothetical protein
MLRSLGNFRLTFVDSSSPRIAEQLSIPRNHYFNLTRRIDGSSSQPNDSASGITMGYQSLISNTTELAQATSVFLVDFAS